MCGQRFTDYRRIPRALSHVYYSPLTPENRAEIDKLFNSMTTPPSASSSSPLADPVVANRPLTTFGRTIRVPLSTSRVARFTFDELCARPLSAADYLEITRVFGTVFVTDVPKLGIGRKDVVSLQSAFPASCSLWIGPAVHYVHRRVLRVQDKAVCLLRGTHLPDLFGRRGIRQRSTLRPHAERDGRSSAYMLALSVLI